ncbi:MAG: TadE family protein [Anaerolineales bacterium]
MIFPKWKKSKQYQVISGQALVEFAFVLPILILLIVAVVDFGILFYVQMVVINAAWEGGRAGATIVNPVQGDQEIMGAVHKVAYGLDFARLKIDIDPTQDESPRNLPYPAPRGEMLTLTVTYPVRLSFPHLLIPVSGRSVSCMEYQNP